MYSMIIRDSIDSDDIEITAPSLQEFHENITSVLTGINYFAIGKYLEIG